MFKSINNLAPSYLSDLLYPNNPTGNLRCGDQRLLSVPRSRLKYRDKAFAFAGPSLHQIGTVFHSLSQSLNHLLKHIYFLWLLVYGMNLWFVLCFMFLFGQPCLLILNVLYK